MDINKKAREFASYIKDTEEFKILNRSKSEIEKNKSIKRQLDSYVNKKNKIYSNYQIEDASKKISQLNRDHNDFFNLPIVSSYMDATKNFNTMMENLYKSIEKELLR